MGKIYQGIEELVGHTPLVNFRRLAKAEGVNAEILAKLECFNPAGSAKDRVGLQMVLDAEKAGILKRGSVIIEPTGGNTGVGLAAVAAARGYKTVIVMPDSMSEERRMLLKAHGAELVLTDGKKGMQGAIEKAEELQKTTDNSWIAGQFTNPSNPDAHYHSTGPEIWEDTDGKVDIFVATVGTGGTITGTARYLKEMNPSVYVAAVEPAGSLDTGIYDEIITAKEEDAYRLGKAAAREEGFLTGISSGAALWAAVVLGRRPENEGKRIVAVLPDTGERYLSTELFR